MIGLALFAVTVVAGTLLAGRLRVQTPLLLLAVGILGSYLPFVAAPALSPELILIGILPPLLYAAAVNTSLLDFRENLSSIGWLSVGLVLFTAVGVGLVVWKILGVPFAAAFAIGAVVAPPDAVAATAVARQIGLPRRVVTILEGESLVNDATALVSLRTAVAALAAPVTILGVGLDFAKAVGIAVLVGLVVAKLGSLVFARINNPQIATTLTFLVPFVAYAPAEELHASGVLAVVVAGLFLGHQRQRTQTAQARMVQQLNWATVQFLLENSVFLLVGLQFRRILTEGLAETPGWRLLGICAAVLATVILLRVLWVAGSRLWLRPAMRLRGREPALTWQESAVVSWAGMRGVVTLAAALTLPLSAPLRATLVLVALSTTIGTLVLQGLTLPKLALRLGVHGPDPREDALQEATILQAAMADGMTAARDAAGPDDQAIVERLEEGHRNRVNAAWERLGRPNEEVGTPSDTYRRLRLEALRAEREAVLTMRSQGAMDQEVLARVLAVFDMEESMLVLLTDREQAVSSAAPLAPPLPEAPCSHLAEAPATHAPAHPANGIACLQCQIDGTTPVHLRMCLTCGEVGCCDSSEGRHATRHHEETGHPVMRSVEPGESWRWCYLDAVLGR